MPDFDAATLRLGDHEETLRVVQGTEGGPAIDISALRKNTGFITLDGGFGNTAETTSAITFINGEEGVLRYRGYAIEQLAEHASFLEVAYLLYHGQLPTADQLEAYTTAITEHTLLREDMKHLFEAFPMDAHPMQILATATSALASYYPDALDPHDEDAIAISTTRLLAKLPTVAAWAYKHAANQPYVYPRNELGYIENFLYMMFALPVEDYSVDPIVADALNKLFILHADHGQNCSASAVRLVGSGDANIFSSISSGIHALSGPLHGLANQSVLEMLEMIVADGGDLQKWIDKAKDRSDPFRLMGFGHRVYRNFDPRARIIEETARTILNKLGVDDPMLDLAHRLEEAAVSDDYFAERRLYPNVDFYSGIIYRAIGFPMEMFTVLFALGRLPGWIAQWREMQQDPSTRIYRPRQVYTGDTVRDYLPIGERSST